MREQEKEYVEIPNSGDHCRCGAWMFARIYETYTLIICPQCGDWAKFDKKE